LSNAGSVPGRTPPAAFRASASRAPAGIGFSHAEFSGSAVYFVDAKFSGGKVDFSGTGAVSLPPVGPWTDPPPPGVILPKKEDQFQV
jgi:hypothetical protein